MIIAALLVAALGGAGAGLYAFAWDTPPGPRSARAFDPDRLADLELAMWQAYYQKDKPRLLSLLVRTLREQLRYPWSKATQASFHLARAAATFGDAHGDYDRVLPDLERAYAISREWTSSGYDPAQVARAELAWWAARRDPARRNPETVGGLIADLYAAFYEVPRARVLEAGLLRAQAGTLRDIGGAQADWPRVKELLRASYRSLYTAVRLTRHDL